MGDLTELLLALALNIIGGVMANLIIRSGR